MTTTSETIPAFVRRLLLIAPILMIGCSGPIQTASRNEHLVMSVLWFQTSAEMRAQYYQTFNLAKMKVDQDTRAGASIRKRAIVLDIDETVLDNSPQMGKLIKENEVFPYAWTEWVNAARAEALPGAVDFLKYAVSKGYDVFYVSNRSAATELDGTIRNLVAQGFPQVDESHILLMTGGSSKEARRDSVLQTHEIALLIGDNLNDLAKVFERKSVADRFAEVDRVKDEFGNKFLVLPNPMYGAWESAIYENKSNLTDEQKHALRKAALKGF